MLKSRSHGRALAPRRRNHARSPHLASKRFMEHDPLDFDRKAARHDRESINTSKHQFYSPRSAGRSLTVLLAGYNSFFAQHLYTHLTREGFTVIPVTHKPLRKLTRVQSLTFEQIKEHGLPDVDFVINATGRNLYSHNWNSQEKNITERAKLESNSFLSQQIRKSNSKPYAFLNVSSALYYPSSLTTEYDESYELPALPLESERNRPELHAQELSLPYFSRLFRDAESHARVFIPEIDYKTPEQLEEYRRMKKEIIRDNEKWAIHGNVNYNLTPQEMRDRSERKDLLQNHDVREVSLRLGHLVCKNMQEVMPFEAELSSGFGAPVGTGKTIHPWIHVDDACQMVIWAMVNEKIRGPLNCVAPRFATNEDLFNFTQKARQIFRNPFFNTVSPKSVDHTLGPVRGSVFHESRKVVPAVAHHFNFEYQYPSIHDAIENGTKSILEQEIFEAGGVEKLWRFQLRSTIM